MQIFSYKTKLLCTLLITLSATSFHMKGTGCCNAIVEPVECCFSTTDECFSNKTVWIPTPYSIKINPQELINKHIQDDEHNIRFLTNFTYESTLNDSSNGYLGSRPFWTGSNRIVFGNNGTADSTGYDTAGTPIPALTGDIDAYQFGLGNLNELHTISLNFNMQRFGTNLRFNYQQLFNDNKGYYFNVELPIVATRINYCINEPEFPDVQKVEDDQFIAYPTDKVRYENMTQAFNAGISTPAEINGHHNRVISLEYGRIANDQLTSIRPADLIISGGFIYQESLYHRGFCLGLKAVCPTGDVPTARYVIEPLTGRGGYWGLGADMSGYHKLWSNEDDNKSATLLVQAEILHLAPSKNPKMARSFDLAQNGPGSRYLLVQDYLANNAPGTYSAGGITQAVNITTFPVISKFSYDASAVIGASINICTWNIDFGARAWGRSKECLNINYPACLQTDYHYTLNDYAVLGRQISVNSDPTTAILNLCEPLARINQSAIRVKSLPVPTDLEDIVKDATNPANRIPTNINQALDIAGAALPASRTFGGFLNIGYSWNTDDHSSKIAVLADLDYSNDKIHTWMIGAQYKLTF